MQCLLETLPLRERPAWRVAYHTEGCSLVELLAALLGGRRQIETAQALLARFGSEQRLARATADELAGVAGIGPAQAARLLAALELGRRFLAESHVERPSIHSPEDAAVLLMHRVHHLDQEHMFVLILDTRNRLIGEPVQVYRGSLNSSLVRVGEILRPAVRVNAAALIVVHNHPSGDPSPSPEDVAVTRAIVKAGKLLDVDVLDHLIIGDGRFVSLKSQGLGFN